MKTTGLHIGLVGPLPPPSGGMANQMQQLAKLLRDEGILVELIQVNRSYRPRWVEQIKGIRATTVSSVRKPTMRSCFSTKRL